MSKTKKTCDWHRQISNSQLATSMRLQQTLKWGLSWQTRRYWSCVLSGWAGVTWKCRYAKQCVQDVHICRTASACAALDSMMRSNEMRCSCSICASWQVAAAQAKLARSTGSMVAKRRALLHCGVFLRTWRSAPLRGATSTLSSLDIPVKRVVVVPLQGASAAT